MVHPRRMRGERGSTLVETALVLPLGMAVLLGIFTGGNAYYTKISLTDAARDGARYGASLKVPEGAGGIDDWRNAVKARVAELSGGEITATEVCADLVETGTTSLCPVDDPAVSASDPARLVKVSLAKPAELNFIFFNSSPTLTAKITARYERDAT